MFKILEEFPEELENDDDLDFSSNKLIVSVWLEIMLDYSLK